MLRIQLQYEEIIKFSKAPQQQQHSRDEYKELLKFTIIFSGL